MRMRSSSAVVALSGVLMSGCYQKVPKDGSVVVSFQVWAPLLVALIGLGAVPVGVVLFSRKKRFWGVVAAVGGVFAAVAIAPIMYLDRVVVGPEGFTSRHGFWWNPVIHDVRYDELRQVQLVVEERSERRGKSYNYSFDFSFKSGKTERVPLGDVMREAMPEISEAFRKHGVQVQIPPNLPE